MAADSLKLTSSSAIGIVPGRPDSALFGSFGSAVNQLRQGNGGKTHLTGSSVVRRCKRPAGLCRMSAMQMLYPGGISRKGLPAFLGGGCLRCLDNRQRTTTAVHQRLPWSVVWQQDDRVAHTFT